MEAPSLKHGNKDLVMIVKLSESDLISDLDVIYFFSRNIL